MCSRLQVPVSDASIRDKSVTLSDSTDKGNSSASEVDAECEQAWVRPFSTDLWRLHTQAEEAISRDKRTKRL